MRVTVKYVDPSTGEIKETTKDIEYTVGAASGVAVSADKMNVLYIGVDNPLTITAGAGAEKVNAQFQWWSSLKQVEVNILPGQMQALPVNIPLL